MGKIEFYDAKRHNLHHHPPVIVAMIKSDNVILMGHSTRVGETGNSCKLLVCGTRDGNILGEIEWFRIQEIIFEIRPSLCLLWDPTT